MCSYEFYGDFYSRITQYINDSLIKIREPTSDAFVGLTDIQALLVSGL